MHVADSIKLSDFSTTAEGFLVFDKARIARTGIQTYRASELGDAFRDMDSDASVRVYRSPDEVFDAASIASIAGKPITIDHPSAFVNAENAERLIVGVVGDALTQDGEFLTGALRIFHAAGVKAVKDGKRELSVGYDTEIERTAGTTPDGETYDAIQRAIRGNHVALVDRGRCGPTCRLHDGPESNGSTCKCQENDMTLKMVDCGGSNVEMTDAAVVALKSLVATHDTELATRDAKISDAETKIADLETKLAAADAKLEDSQKKLDEAEAKLTPEALDAAGRDRAQLVEDAKKLAPDLDCKTLDAEGIKTSVLKALDVDIEGKSSAYIEGAFETRASIARDAKESGRAAAGLAGALKTKAKANDAGDPESAREAYIARTRDAHKGEND